MAYVEYRVTQADTLESIATRFLGSPSRWREIASLNRLRSPFISDDPSFQYGPAITSGTLTSTISANALSYTFQASELPVYQTTFGANCVFFVQSGSNYDAMTLSVAVTESTGTLTFKPSISLALTQAVTGSALSQTVNVNNIDGVLPGLLLQVDAETATVSQISGTDADVPQITTVLASSHLVGALGSYGFQHGYSVGSVWTLFGPQPDNRLRVLRPGDPLRIPTSGAVSNIAQTGDALFANLLGTDVLTSQGVVQIGVNGDMQRVSGTKNLAQALRNRLNTALGTYFPYPNYGNAIWDFVGATTDPYFQALAAGLVRQTLLSDPRVSSVESTSVTIQGATINIDAVVRIIQTSSLLRLDNLVVIGR